MSSRVWILGIAIFIGLIIAIMSNDDIIILTLVFIIIRFIIITLTFLVGFLLF
jgi:hypothetical protein